MLKKKSVKKNLTKPKSPQKGAVVKKKIKPQAKRNMTAKKTDDHKNKLIKSLNEIIKELDENSLLFMVKQAQTLHYNMHVDKLNSAQAVEGKNMTKPSENNKIQGQTDIIEGNGGKFFIFIIKGARKTFSLEEMRKVVKICHASEDETDASGRLYSWLTNNRKDVINDAFLNSRNDPAIKMLYNKIINKYTVKES